MNRNIYKSLILIIVLLAVITLLFSLFIVNETEQVVITQFGKPVGDAITTPGIHFKIPLIQKVHVFDKRFLEWDGDANQVPTKDKRFIWVDTYARWKIVDPLRFFQRVRDERGAQSRLDDIIDGETRNVIASHNLVELIRSSNREPQVSQDLTAEEQSKTFPEIKMGRPELTKNILEHSMARCGELGIELLDMQFKRINYVKEVQEKIFDRMISERKRMAERFRSEGAGEANRIMGEKERDLKQIQSEAYKTAQEIRGNADAEATTIYAKVHNQSSDSRTFYKFLKTMESYENALSDKDWLILSTDGDFFKYLKQTQ